MVVNGQQQTQTITLDVLDSTPMASVGFWFCLARDFMGAGQILEIQTFIDENRTGKR